MKYAHLVVALILPLGISGQAAAVTQARVSQQTAVSNCHTALPSAEGAFRHRPLGIANEGSSTAFISCGIPVEVLSSTGVTDMVVFFTNKTAADVNVSCTLITGLGAFAPLDTRFIPKTFTLPAGPSPHAWTSGGDNGGERFKTPSISCGIPANVEINATTTIYDTDVGQ